MGAKQSIDGAAMVPTSTDGATAGPLSPQCRWLLSRNVQCLLDDYRNAQPFPHLVLDNLFPDEQLKSLIKEMPSGSSENWVNERTENRIKSSLRSAVYLGEYGYSFAAMLHSAAFLYFLRDITGIRALLPDPYLAGAGFHVMKAGGKFEVHADANSDPTCGMQRRLAMLVYLNEDWESDFGGQLELWNQSGMFCEKVIEPSFNRTVIFEIGDKNFHAVRPVVADSGRSRKSFAAYFHTASLSLAPHNSIYASSMSQTPPTHFHRVMRETTPPLLWQALRKLKHLTHR